MTSRIPLLFDATSLPPAWGGVARYIQGVLGGFDELGISVHVVAKPVDVERLRTTAPGHEYHASPAYVGNRVLRFAWEQRGLPRLARRLGATAIHSPHYTHPLVTRAKRIVTVHDATFFSDAGVHSRLKGVFFRFWMRRAAAHADALVTPSRATAEEMRRHTRVRRAEIVVAYLGVDRSLFHPVEASETARFAARHGLRPELGWIAFLGTIEPRKNVGGLIRAHRALTARAAASTPGDAVVPVPPLVISGARGWDDDAIALLDSATPGDGVIEAGYLPVRDLPAFLGGATVVAYPSLGEGFGLPVLEAMACGAAVLTTRRLSIPEVGGDCVAYTEPDAEHLASALGALIADRAQRADLGERAESRAGEFTWEACANAHLEAYRAAGTALA
ncbi:glycosyltransferase family 4 protein [Herbiconiux sp. CPCC 205763]|uniref:Glycosyltransferase family 4 protein n=1 Tax=Herbiconiux aconitum TaxID=2970913 RepID=A0ABT2GK76_9MICO|nr:glycosyltransferase family 1 protein [Herbiconiux aconitum]MCS5716620.1 glycosyltransferase family 4 protein [Herbiconiux aconitum]